MFKNMKLKTNKKTGRIEEVVDTTQEVFLHPIREASFFRSWGGIRVKSVYFPLTRADINEWFSRFNADDSTWN